MPPSITVPPTSRANTKDIASKNQSPREVSTVRPAEGAKADSRIGVAESTVPAMADFYRNGRPVASVFEKASKSYDTVPSTFRDFDGSRASIRMFTAGNAVGKPITSEIIPPYTKLILNQVQESHAERSQIIETFGDFYVFMFGERPPTYTFSGFLVNSKNANWVADFMYYYDNFLRGTKCLERQAKTVITYGGRQIEGYILNVSHALDAVSEGAVPINFTVVVTRRNYLGFSDDFGVTLSSSGVLAEDAELAGLVKSTAEIGKGSSDPEASQAFNKATEALAGSPAMTSVPFTA